MAALYGLGVRGTHPVSAGGVAVCPVRRTLLSATTCASTTTSLLTSNARLRTRSAQTRSQRRGKERDHDRRPVERGGGPGDGRVPTYRAYRCHGRSCPGATMGLVARSEPELRGVLDEIGGDGSVAGRIGAPFEAVYSATKSTEVGLAESLGVELSAFGIAVSTVNPGPVDTGFFDARGHGYDRSFPGKVSPARVAAAVVRAMERRRLGQLVPRWLHSAVAFRHLAPPLYEWGTRRSFKRKLAELERSR